MCVCVCVCGMKMCSEYVQVVCEGREGSGRCDDDDHVYMRHEQMKALVFFSYAVAPMTVAIEQQR